MIHANTRRVATRLAMLCVALLVVGAALGAVAPAAADGPQPTVNATNTTDTTDDTPSQADTLRVTPESPDKEYLDIETRSSDEVYNTTGPYATFTLSEPIESARLEQSNADVRVMGEGHTLRIEYDEDAAGDDGSLYTAELFFDDGSTHSIDLYAYETDVSLQGAEYAAYSSLIDHVTSNAEADGFEATPAGALEYVEHTEERAELFDSLFTEHVIMFITMLFTLATNFVTWVVLFAIIAGLAIYFERKHGWILRLQQMAESRAELMREAVRQDYEDRRNAAAKHPLEDVTEIGPNASRYWRELGVETVDDMVEVACKGVIALGDDGQIRYNDDGEVIYAHHGVDDLKNVDPLTLEQLRSETWLGSLILEGRLAPTTALSNIEAALLVAEKEYNRGNEVREARRTVAELNARLAGKRSFEDAETSSNAARPNRRTDYSGAATGGD